MLPDDAYLAGLALLPDYMRGGMRRWIEHAIPPGSFLCAVLRNDFEQAAARADHVNAHRLFDYAEYLYNYAPAQCHGSPERFEAWQGLAKMGLYDGPVFDDQTRFG